MVIDKIMEKSINDQIQAEFDSAYLYLSMAAWFEEHNLPGCAHWMKKQVMEENEHAMKFFHYLVSRGGRVELQAIGEPKREWKNATEVFIETLAHERKVTARIYAMTALAQQEKDYATENLLVWYVDEQVEEEDTAAKILTKFKQLGEIPVSLNMLDKELGAR